MTNKDEGTTLVGAEEAISREIATVGPYEIAVSVEFEGVLIHGDGAAVERYLAELTSIDVMDIAGVAAALSASPSMQRPSSGDV